MGRLGRSVRYIDQQRCQPEGSLLPLRGRLRPTLRRTTLSNVSRRGPFSADGHTLAFLVDHEAQHELRTVPQLRDSLSTGLRDLRSSAPAIPSLLVELGRQPVNLPNTQQVLWCVSCRSSSFRKGKGRQRWDRC